MKLSRTQIFGMGSDIWPGLGKLIEECGEVVQIAGKLIETGGSVVHWEGPPLDDRLADELGDLLAAIYFVIDHCLQHKIDHIDKRRMAKYNQFVEWRKEGDPIK
jgi:NTP pyrophosphatase (non-canonical NTP hydrolase)